MTISERLTRTKARLDAYYEAEIAILAGQEYKIGTRSLKRADIAEIRITIKDLEIQVLQLESMAAGKGPRRSIRVTPRDL
jgi:hypothetical protein